MIDATLQVHWDVFFKVASAYGKYVENVAEELAGQLRYEAPRDTGNLAGRFSKVQGGAYEWNVGTNVVYSLPIIGMTVRHQGASGKPPIGQRGNDYPDRAIDSTVKKLRAIAYQTAQQAGI